MWESQQLVLGRPALFLLRLPRSRSHDRRPSTGTHAEGGAEEENGERDMGSCISRPDGCVGGQRSSAEATRRRRRRRTIRRRAATPRSKVVAWLRLRLFLVFDLVWGFPRGPRKVRFLWLGGESWCALSWFCSQNWHLSHLVFGFEWYRWGNECLGLRFLMALDIWSKLGRDQSFIL